MTSAQVLIITVNIVAIAFERNFSTERKFPGYSCNGFALLFPSLYWFYKIFGTRYIVALNAHCTCQTLTGGLCAGSCTDPVDLDSSVASSSPLTPVLTGQGRAIVHKPSFCSCSQVSHVSQASP